MRAVLQFSGGKDSLACLYKLKSMWDQLTVMWVNTGAAFPETLKQMAKVRGLVPHFVEIQSDQPKQIEAHGYPADVVPIRSTLLGQMVHGKRVSIQSFMDCCHANLWSPTSEAVRAMGFDVVIRGQRNADGHKSPIRSGDVVDGITYWFPLENWSELDVLDFLKAEDIDLPEHYQYFNSSLDCWSCTAYADSGKMRYMKEKHPELWEKLRPRFKAIAYAVESDLVAVCSA